jgi:hypothetical protein
MVLGALSEHHANLASVVAAIEFDRTYAVTTRH